MRTEKEIRKKRIEQPSSKASYEYFALGDSRIGFAYKNGFTDGQRALKKWVLNDKGEK